uniref:Ig-like domain-containing protein n=1 Tax=Taeniopygia guttata TaxID=59729 RepID=A0A674HCD5_TAEGU
MRKGKWGKGALGVLGGSWGAPPELCPALTAVFQSLVYHECHFTNGTERVRYVLRYIYNRQQYVMFDSDVGEYVGFTPYGERNAKRWNSNPGWMEYKRTAVDRFCRCWYKTFTPFLTERRVPPSVSISLVPSSSQPGPGRLLCSVLDFYPAPIQVRWFQGQQELSEHVVATEVVPNGDWSYQLLVLCQVEHGSLEHPLSQSWEMPPDAARSKMLTGIGGFVLGSLFLALGLGFYLRKKVRGGAGGRVPPGNGEHPPESPGNIPLCALGTSPCVHWEHPPVCIGNIPLCALGTSPCVHWEHPCSLQGRQW